MSDSSGSLMGLRLEKTQSRKFLSIIWRIEYDEYLVRAPQLGTPMKEFKLTEALFTKIQQAVLGLLFLNTDQSYHLRGIVRKSGIGQGTIQRELKRLTEAGIIQREQVGQQSMYRANRDCPIFTELHTLVIKTFGVIDRLSTA